ncbi:Protein AEXR-1, partial [Aphelenchoides avenae]
MSYLSSQRLTERSSMVVTSTAVGVDCTWPEGLDTFEAVAEYTLVVSSLIANAFSIAAIFCAFQLHRRTGDTMHIFVVSMTVGDMLCTSYAYPYTYLTSRNVMQTELIPCAASSILSWLGIAISGLSLALLNIDKLIYFRWPLRYLLVSTRAAVLTSVFACGVAIVFVSCVWASGAAYEETSLICIAVVGSSMRFVYDIYVICFCIVPVASSLVLSVYLFLLTRRRRQKQASKSDPKLSEKLQSLAFIFAATAWTSFSLLPYRISYLVSHYLLEPIDSGYCQPLDWISTILIYLLFSNA